MCQNKQRRKYPNNCQGKLGVRQMYTVSKMFSYSWQKLETKYNHSNYVDHSDKIHLTSSFSRFKKKIQISLCELPYTFTCNSLSSWNKQFCDESFLFFPQNVQSLCFSLASYRYPVASVYCSESQVCGKHLLILFQNFLPWWLSW